MWSKGLNLNHSAVNKESVIHLLRGIRAVVPVQCVYVHNNFFAGNVLKEMLIMVPFKQVRILNELKPLLNIVFNGQTDFGYRLFHVHEIEQVLQAGSLFFDYATIPQNCLFSKSESFLDRAAAKPIAELVKSIYQQEIEKASNFLLGAKFYFKKQNFEYCAFMLHQVFDLMYRAIEVLIMGKDKKTHSINAHQFYVKPYVKPLSKLFNQHEEDVALLHLLDEAYLAVRYENNYKINKTDVVTLFEKAGLLYHIAGQVYQGVMNNHFDQQVIDMYVC